MPTILTVRWRQQAGRCVWCGRLTWLAGAQSWQDGKDALKLSHRSELFWRRATREHIMPRSLGGANDDYNIAMACRACNSRRGNDPRNTVPNAFVACLLPHKVQEVLYSVNRLRKTVK